MRTFNFDNMRVIATTLMLYNFTKEGGINYD